MDTQTISIFIEEVEEAMIASGYSKTTVRGHRKIWRRFAEYEKVNPCDFSYEHLVQFVDDCYLGQGKAGRICRSYRQSIVRAVAILDEYGKYGTAAFSRQVFRKKYDCPEPYEIHIRRYFELKCDIGLSESWKVSFTAEMRKFVTFLESKNIVDFAMVTPETISQYVRSLDGYSSSMLSAMLGRLRGFFKWLFADGVTSRDFSVFFPSVNRCSFPSYVPATWENDEITRMLNVIDRESPVGKRDYAVLLLLSKTGLRASDALFLKHADLNWETNTISIVQKKTNQVLTLPLLEDVGLAIIDYVRNGRPTSGSQCIFVRHTPPFSEFLGGHRFHYQIRKYLDLAGISKPDGKTCGTHTFRHTFANELLKKQTPLPVISEILGHTSIHSTANYLRTDIEQLRLCAIDTEV